MTHTFLEIEARQIIDDEIIEGQIITKYECKTLIILILSKEEEYTHEESNKQMQQ